MARRIVILSLTVGLLWCGTAHADPITALLTIIGFATATASAITAGIVTAIVGSVISFGITAISGALTKKKTGAASSFAQAAEGRVQVTRSSVESHKLVYGMLRVAGPLVYVNTTNAQVYIANVKKKMTKRSNVLHMVIPLACHEIEDIVSITIDEKVVALDADGFVTTAPYVTTYPRAGGITHHILVKKHLGNVDQPADPDLMAAFPGVWTEKHQLRGIAYIYVQLKYFGYNTAVGGQDVFPNGVPAISAIIKGKKVYDPRTGLTVWSDNWALCMRDYLTDQDYGVGAVDIEIDDDSVVASANICDENVVIADGTQKRYQCNAQIDTANSPMENLKDLVTGGAGVIPYSQGKFRIFAGAYTTPVLTVDESWLAGQIEVQAKTPRSDLFNAVKGVYVDPDKKWQPTDFPIVRNALYESQDGGFQIAQDLELPCTTNSIAAQRIAKILLEKSRQGIIWKAACNWKAMQLAVWDTVYVRIAKLGWTDKVFRVISWELSEDATINLTFQEDSSASYDWNNGEATTFDPAPDTDLPDSSHVDVPGNPIVTETVYSTIDGSVKSQAFLEWAESETAFVNIYIVRWKLASEDETAYRQEPQILGNSYKISELAPGRYNFEVKAVNLSGASSDYAATLSEIYGYVGPPAALTGLTVNVVAGEAHLRWDVHPDPVVRSSGTIRIKYAAFLNDWSAGQDIVEVNGSSTSVVIPAKSGFYFAKPFVGNIEALDATVVVCEPANSLNLVTVAATDDDEGSGAYSGTLTGFTKVAAGGGYDLYFDALGADPDDGFVETGEYIFAEARDFGIVQRFTLESFVSLLAFDATSSFDAAAGTFDEREGTFDGGDISNATVEFFVKTTNDDPTGTVPTDSIWSDWQRLLVADLKARAFWFRFVGTNLKSSNQVVISSAYVAFSKYTRTERFLNQTISSAGTDITYTDPYFQKPFVGVNIQTPTSGDTIKIEHVMDGTGVYFAGAKITILNGGTGAGRTVDASVTGI